MAEASASDVRLEIETYLEDDRIGKLIERVARDIDRDADTTVTGDDRKDLEAVMTALHITTTIDRAETRADSGRGSVTYEKSTVEELQRRAARLGASDSLLGIDANKPTFSLDVP